MSEKSISKIYSIFDREIKRAMMNEFTFDQAETMRKGYEERGQVELAYAMEAYQLMLKANGQEPH